MTGLYRNDVAVDHELATFTHTRHNANDTAPPLAGYDSIVVSEKFTGPKHNKTEHCRFFRAINDPTLI